MEFIEGFFKRFDNKVCIEDSVLWYCIDMLGLEGYKNMTIHERINFKQLYFELSCALEFMINVN